ncbi:MAG: DMT family transporter [Oscillospiraceae bacterium]|nr:DMT family transporter [Oscillospiraceae bacterium]MBQ2796039.1 DMT family transporter [Oscillospiraceae bacterium]MBQ3236107.1 DMT family transporter [Oscillospiraceae bacterium]MBQ3560621.1 DMT family transporter [Oscillospiraceae bacterium]
MNNKAMLGNVLLILTAFIWGCAFVAQSVGMDFVGPFTFNGTRCIIGGIVLIIANIVFDAVKKKNGTYKEPSASEKKELLKGGIICGIIIFAASTIQQFGIAQTTVGKAGFISVLYILIVPFLGILLKQKLPKMIWICCALALCGLYLLCMTESFSLSKGDFTVLVSAIAYAIHIIAIDHFAPKVDCVKLSCIQFLIAGAVSVIFMFIFENPDIEKILEAWLPILYAGALSGGVGYTLQTVAQKWTKPSVASLLMSFESVFAVLAGAVLLHQIPSLREIAGCLFMFASIIIIQLPEKKKAGEIK